MTQSVYRTVEILSLVPLDNMRNESGKCKFLRVFVSVFINGKNNLIEFHGEMC